MMRYRWSLAIVSALTLLVLYQAGAQVIDTSATGMHRLDKKQWQELTKDIDYSEDEVPVSKNAGTNIKSPFQPMFLKYIFFTAVVVVLAFLIIKTLKRNSLLKKKAPVLNEITAAEEEEEEEELSGLETYYRQALADKNFRTAFRYGYLIIIRELSANNLINWKRQKTNNDYVYELHGQHELTDFKEITRLFEKAWYGESALTEEEFNGIDARVQLFLDKLKVFIEKKLVPGNA